MHHLLITKLVTRQDRFHMQTPFASIVYRVSIRFTMNLLLLAQLSLCFQVISVPEVQLSSIQYFLKLSIMKQTGFKHYLKELAYGSCNSYSHTVIHNREWDALPTTGRVKVRHSRVSYRAGTYSEIRAEHEVQSLSLRCSHIWMPEVNTQNDTGASIGRSCRRNVKLQFQEKYNNIVVKQARTAYEMELNIKTTKKLKNVFKITPH